MHAAGEQDGFAFLAMRLVDGDDLRTLVRRDGPLPVERACALVEQAATALDAIHRAGFVHRDVKPGNLLVDRFDHLYLTDFGLVKQVLTTSESSRTSGWVGTVDFMAPEQIRGERIDARTDVYSLGGVLHYLLTGRVPYVREGEEAKLAVGRSGVWTAVHSAGGSDLLRYDSRGRPLYKIWFHRRISALAVTDEGVWIDEGGTGRVLRVDPATRDVHLLATIGGTTFGLFAGGGYLWAVLRSEDALAQINLEDGTVVTTAAGRGPTQVAVAGERVFVASRNDHTVPVLDLAGRPAQEPLSVDFNPYALATDGRSVWVTGLANDTVTRIALP